MNKSESIKNIAIALKNFQNEVEQPSKEADNPYYKSKYVALPAVIAAIKKCAPKHGLSYVQAPVSTDRGIGVQTTIFHESGEWIECPAFVLPLEKATAQGGGSCITYAKRYSLSAAFGIDSEFDDDGNEASGNNIPAPAQTQTTGKSTRTPLRNTPPPAPTPAAASNNPAPGNNAPQSVVKPEMNPAQFDTLKERISGGKEDNQYLVKKTEETFRLSPSQKTEIDDLLKKHA